MFEYLSNVSEWHAVIYVCMNMNVERISRNKNREKERKNEKEGKKQTRKKRSDISLNFYTC